MTNKYVVLVCGLNIRDQNRITLDEQRLALLERPDGPVVLGAQVVIPLDPPRVICAQNLH